MKQLKMILDLPVPVDMATQTIGWLGRKRSGKTHGAGAMFEELYKAQVQQAVIDSVGNWHGLRVDADGKSPGLEIVVLGGLQGDIPLNPQSGALVADLVIDSGRSFVIDVSQFSKSGRKQFCTLFGERIWQRKKAQGANATPVHLYLEEAQLIVPQMQRTEIKGEWSAARMMGIWEEIIRLGGNYGIGASLISQRPQSVNNEVLTQVEVLICFQMNGIPERQTVKEWVTYHGLDVNLVKELPGLEVGEAYLWSPQFLKLLQRVRFRRKETYDSSRTPKVGEKRHVVKIRPIDLGALKEQITALEQEAEASDPARLKARVRQLEAELAKKTPSSTVIPVAKTVEKVVEKPVIPEAQLKRVEAQTERFRGALESMRETLIEKVGPVLGTLEALLVEVRSVRDVQSARPPYGAGQRSLPVGTTNRGVFLPLRHRQDTLHRVQAAKVAREAPPANGQIEMKGKSREMLGLLALYPDGVERARLALWVGMAMAGGFNNYLGAMRSSGLVEYPSKGQVRITEAGQAIAPAIALPNTPEERLALWGPKLNPKQRAILDELLEHGPSTKEALAALVQMDPGGGGFNNYLGQLRTAGLITKGDPINLSAFVLEHA